MLPATNVNYLVKALNPNKILLHKFSPNMFELASFRNFIIPDFLCNTKVEEIKKSFYDLA